MKIPKIRWAMLLILIFVIVINLYYDEENVSVSDYQLLPRDKDKLVEDERKINGFLELDTQEPIIMQNSKENFNLVFGSSDEEGIFIDREKVTDKLEGVNYFPNPNVIYAFGQDKPINIMFGAPASQSNDPYDSPLYIGYFDGTCEYPAEFDYVRSKRKCNQYLQDTLDFVGFDTVDEMLEYSFGDYITK